MKTLTILSIDPGCHLIARDDLQPGFAEIRFTAPEGLEGRYPRRYLGRDGALKLRNWLSAYLDECSPQETPPGGSESPVEPISDAPKGEVPGAASEAAHGAPTASGAGEREWEVTRDRMRLISNGPRAEDDALVCDVWESCDAICERLEALLEEVSGQRRRSEEWQRLASASAYQEILKLIPEDRARWLKKLLGEES